MNKIINYTSNIIQFLQAIWRPGEVREVRALKRRDEKFKWEKNKGGFFDNPKKAAFEIQRINATDVYQGIYITLNPVDPTLLARCHNRLDNATNQAKDADITELEYLLADIDPERKADISATDEEKAAAKELAQKIIEDYGKPIIMGDSANGYQLLYRHNANKVTQENVDRLRAFLQLLAQKYDNDKAKIDIKVFNPARISKVFGTWARKGDSIPDRPHRQAQLLEVNPEISILEIPPLPEPKPKPEPEQKIKIELKNIPQEFSPTKIPNHFPTNGQTQNLDLAKQIITQGGYQIKEEKNWKGGSIMLCLQQCIFDPSHDRNGRGNDASIIVGYDGVISYQCHHNSCRGRTWREARNQIEGIKPTYQPIPTKDSLEEQIKALDYYWGEKNILLDRDKLHPICNRFLDGLDGVTDTPDEYLVTNLIGAFGGSMGNRVCLDWGLSNIYPNVYALTVGRSSIMRKTTGQTLALTFLEDLHLNGHRILFPEDVTPETFFEHLSGNPCGISRHSEFGGFLAKMEKKYAGGFKELLTDFYDVPRIRIKQRKNSKGDVVEFCIQRPAITLLGASTIDWIKKYTSNEDSDSGFLARFLISNLYEPTKKPISRQKKPKWDWANWRKLFENLMQLKHTFHLCPELEGFYDIWFDKHREDLQKKEEIYESFLVRLESYILKFFTMFKAVDFVQNTKENPILNFDRAEYLTSYYEKNVEQILMEIIGTANNKDEKKIMEKIKKEGGRIPHSKLLKYTKLRRDDFNSAIENLIDQDYLLKIQTKTKGRENTTYYIKP